MYILIEELQINHVKSEYGKPARFFILRPVKCATLLEEEYHVLPIPFGRCEKDS